MNFFMDTVDCYAALFSRVLYQNNFVVQDGGTRVNAKLWSQIDHPHHVYVTVSVLSPCWVDTTRQGVLVVVVGWGVLLLAGVGVVATQTLGPRIYKVGLLNFNQEYFYIFSINKRKFLVYLLYEYKTSQFVNRKEFFLVNDW